MTNKKYVYGFQEGNKDMRELLGGKGANLAEMTNLGVNVPYGFTVTTEACTRYFDEGEKLWPEVIEEIKAHVKEVEEKSGKTFGDVENPLLFSVRSGAVQSMPGMMDTILNLGLNDESVKGLARTSGDERFAYDSYRRFIQRFAGVALGLPSEKFEEALEAKREKAGVELDSELSAEYLKELVKDYEDIYKSLSDKQFPQDPMEQLMIAVEAVFGSWNNDRAIYYRRMNHIPDNLGTAVNVQLMVFGNSGDNSGTGVAFSRNPATGENHVFGEYLMNAQGEDVVAGIRTPQHLDSLSEIMPEVHDEFIKTAKRLEEHYTDMQDLEFTIENGKLFILQTRNGKRTAAAAVKVAVDLVNEGLIDKETAITRVEPAQLDQLLHPQFDPKALAEKEPITSGLAASPGAAYGKISFTADDAHKRNANGERVLLVRTETSPEDLAGMDAADGILTARGGMTSHAAVVARGMGKCCVSGASIKVNMAEKHVEINGKTYGEDDILSIDGTTGKVYEGKIETQEATVSGDFATFMEWIDEIRDMGVRANADSKSDAETALKLGAEGIGLTRTEHMFFGEGRINAIREMIVSDNAEDRAKALDKILPLQEEDFYGIYKVMEERPVTIRLLDPPLHEFTPHSEEEFEDLAEASGKSVEELKTIAEGLKEVNPMLGHRGLRLAITYPEIYKMQVRAIIQAALRVHEEGIKVVPEIMIPLAGDPVELKRVKDSLIEEIELVFEEQGKEIEYHIGTMIEIPRATLLADEIAKEVDFFSFGTNDLTQLTYGFSRDDAGKFLTEYVDKGIFEYDPFKVLDQKGVGQLVDRAVKLGKGEKENLHCGICGEHGGDPMTVKFLYNIGLDYVSCSPYRVPIARLAAAQATVEKKRK